jgi:VanZ family protein
MIAGNTWRKLSLLLAIAWAACIWYLSSQSTLPIPMLFTLQDKLMHMVAYGTLGFLLMGARQWPVLPFPAGTWLGVCAVCGLYGVVDEIHQSFVPGRDADVFDVCADVTGALLGAWMLVVLVRSLPCGLR